MSNNSAFLFSRPRCLFIVLLLLYWGVLSPDVLWGYTFVEPPKTSGTLQNSTDDPYYEDLLKRFPDNRETIDALYGDYSGWVVELSQRYGIAPLLAMEALPEDEYPGLFRDSEIFYDIYKSLDAKSLSETDRAVLALKLTNVFLMG
ncbi:MAG: hypothetical protein EOM12_18520, partial [Verrucomicrobiae bacterium]|nr:hypothetical protein [Verrucomicrobiae bacterium]